MTMNLRQAELEDREILANLLEVNRLGLYGYEYLDYYWTEDKRWAYFIEVNGKLAGFAMVIDMPEVEGTQTDFQMAEFFVMNKYRRSGVGK